MEWSQSTGLLSYDGLRKQEGLQMEGFANDLPSISYLLALRARWSENEGLSMLHGRLNP